MNHFIMRFILERSTGGPTVLAKVSVLVSKSLEVTPPEMSWNCERADDLLIKQFGWKPIANFLVGAVYLMIRFYCYIYFEEHFLKIPNYKLLRSRDTVLGIPIHYLR